MADSTDSFISEVRAAFADVPRPADDAMFEKSMLPGDRANATAIFRGQQREDISLEDIGVDADLVFFMSRPAFVYFLPALLTLCLRNPRASHDLFDKISFIFSHDQRNQEHMISFYEGLDVLLDGRMRDTIRQFFSKYEAMSPELAPFDRYWV